MLNKRKMCIISRKREKNAYVSLLISFNPVFSVTNVMHVFQFRNKNFIFNI